MAYKPIPNPSTWTQADWYVDWVAGNDKNPGTALAPVKTVMGGVVAKWGTESPTLPQNTTIHMITSQPLGAESIFLYPEMIDNSMFAIVGSKTLAVATVLGAVTAKNRGAKTLLQAAGLVGHTSGQLIVNTTAGKSSHALVLSVTGPGVATMMQPLVPMVRGVDIAYFPAPAEVDTWAIGDTVDIFDLTTINLLECHCSGPQSNAGPTQGAICWLEGLHLLDPSGVPGTSIFTPEFEGGYFLSVDCWTEQAINTASSTSFLTTYVDCWCQDGFQFSYTYFVGGAISGFGAQFDVTNWLDGDMIIDYPSASTGLLFCGLACINASGSLIMHPGSCMEIRQLYYPGTGILWGDGALMIQANGAVTRRATTTNWVTCLNITTLRLPSAAAVGSGYLGGGTFQDGIAITQANLDIWKGLEDVRAGARFSEDL